MPPMVNIARNATENSMLVVKRMLPPHMVPSQLKILIPVGMPMSIVDSAKKLSAMGPIPVANMWWLHTPHPSQPMSTPLNTITL
jgi:hypothetical protein